MPKDRRKYDRKISDRIYTYADGNAEGIVFLDHLHRQYRVEVRDGETLKTSLVEYDRTKAIKVAHDAVNYLNKRGK